MSDGMPDVTAYPSKRKFDKEFIDEDLHLLRKRITDFVKEGREKCMVLTKLDELELWLTVCDYV